MFLQTSLKVLRSKLNNSFSILNCQVNNQSLRCFSTEQENKNQPELDKLYEMIQLECRANDKSVLDSYETFATTAAKHLGIQLKSVEEPRLKIEKRILLRSAHVHKKHREHYEWRTYFKIMQFKHLTGSTAETFLEYVQRNLPEGVAMIVEKHELQKMPQHLQPPKQPN